MPKIKFLSDDAPAKEIEINVESFADPVLKNRVGYISGESKLDSALKLLSAYYSGAKAVVFDESNHTISEKLEKLGIGELSKDSMKTSQLGFDDFSMMFFTSGTTGEPTGAFKDRENILGEVEALSSVIADYGIKKAVVTVPFIHIYGAAAGLILPAELGIDIIFKEHFLPGDLLDVVDSETLVVTTPLYIKALNRISLEKDLKGAVFVSSTGLLEKASAEEFCNRFNTDVIQVFGSTETGGIAYKLKGEELWTPFKGVEISVNDEELLKVQSPLVSKAVYSDRLTDTGGVIQTFDYIERENGRFRLVGRNSQIVKIAGKRYSTVQIEHILEEVDGIDKALVSISYSKENLRGEVLDIFLETKLDIHVRDIKRVLRKELSNISFAMNLKIVEKIPTSAVGKKLKIEG